MCYQDNASQCVCKCVCVCVCVCSQVRARGDGGIRSQKCGWNKEVGNQGVFSPLYDLKLRPYRDGLMQVGGRRDAVFILLGHFTRKYNL